MEMTPVAKRRRRGTPSEVALDVLGNIPPEQRSSIRVLDLPAGDGVVAIPLSLAGFAVTACDLFPEGVQAQHESLTTANAAEHIQRYWDRQRPPRLVRELAASLPSPGSLTIAGGDMSRPLSFADDTFDIVVCLEGIEHIDTIEALLHELRRVLKPNGRLIISTPNLLCLRARMSYLLTGQRTVKTFIDEWTAVQERMEDRIYHGHVFMIDYFELRYLLFHAGFSIVRPLASRLSFASACLAPFIVPLSLAASFIGVRRARRKFRHLVAEGLIPEGTTPPYKEILQHVFSPALLFGKNLILEVRAR